MKIPRYVLPIVALAFFPLTASANAATPLMWASMFHLVFGNAIIGIIEGLTLAWMFKLPKAKAIVILVGANYVSAWAGGLLIAKANYSRSLPDITILDIQTWFLGFVLAAIVVTLVIEFPFFWFILRSQQHSLRRALVATPLIHAISYALILGWYWWASGTSMMTQLDVVSAETMEVPERYALYYISTNGNEVLRMDLNDQGFAEPIAKVTAHHGDDRLFARPRSDSGSGFDLFLYLASDDTESHGEHLLLEDFSESASVDGTIADGRSNEIQGSRFNYGSVATLAVDSNWVFWTGFWSAQGISGTEKTSGKRVRYSLELPFIAWPVRNATQLAGDYLIFQLGDDQICMMHWESKRIALIARGKGPIVAILRNTVTAQSNRR